MDQKAAAAGAQGNEFRQTPASTLEWEANGMASSTHEDSLTLNYTLDRTTLIDEMITEMFAKEKAERANENGCLTKRQNAARLIFSVSNPPNAAFINLFFFSF